MKQTFDYLENVAFATTVCDKEGIVLYQNAVARQRDGGVIGKTWFEVPGGELSGLIELDIEIPETHPTFNRDLTTVSRANL